MTNKQKLKDVGAERAVIAGICQHGKDALIDVQDILNINVFSSETNQILYKSLEKILSTSSSVDIPSLLSECSNSGHDLSSDKDLTYIKSIFNLPIHLENVRNHARKLMVLDIARKAQIKHQEAWYSLNELTGDENIDAVLSMSEGPIFELSKELHQGREDQPELLGQDSDDIFDDLVNNPVEMIGIPTPWQVYNTVIGGGLRTGVTLIGARPKQGKTTLAKECGLHVAGNLNIPVLMLDTEMKKNDQLYRSWAGLSKVPTKEIETGQFARNKDKLKKVKEAKEYIKKIPYYHKRVGGKPFNEILSIIRRWLYKHVGFDDNGHTNPHLVLYDYFKLMNAETLKEMKEYEALGYQISSFHDFCNDYDTPVLAFVQVNRDGNTRETNDIISQSDRLLWLCISASLYKAKSPEEIAEDGPENGNMKIVPLECRFGAGLANGDYININMNGDISTIEEIGTRNQSIKNKKSGSNTTGFTISEDEITEETEEAPWE